jgi:hypothetical protein
LFLRQRWTQWCSFKGAAGRRQGGPGVDWSSQHLV